MKKPAIALAIAFLVPLSVCPASSAEALGRYVGGASIRGVVRAVEQATVSTSEPLRAVEVKVRDGDRFKRGEHLVIFDCARQRAEKAAAEAVRDEARLNLRSASKLARYHAISRIDVEIAGQRYKRAQSELDALDVRLKDCVFVAPFDGRVAEITLRALERTSAQQPYMRIVSSGELEIEAIVPSLLLAKLRVGTAFHFEIDELGAVAARAKVAAIGASVDPVSKTARIIGRFEQEVPGILPGMSGTLRLTDRH